MLQKIMFRNAVERVLHVKGNYRGGILEMAIVFDCNISKETAKTLAQEVVATLRQQGEVFRNVRLNTIVWKSDAELYAQSMKPFLGKKLVSIDSSGGVNQ